MQFDNKKFYKDLYVKKFFTTYNKKDLLKKIPEDPGRKYRENIYGFRGDLPDGEVDFVFAGCSLTYGSGLSEENIWGNVLSNKYKKNSFLIARPGVSISWIIDQLFTFFKEYGNPPVVLCLFPDLYRINLPVDGNYYRTKNQNKNQVMNNISYFFHSHLEPPEKKIFSAYLRMPYDYEEAVSPYIAINENIRSIRRLEQYCNAVGIKLLWSTWEGEFSDLAKSFEKIEDLKFDNFFDTKNYGNLSSVKLFKDYRKNIFFSSVKKMKPCVSAHTHEECSCYLNCHFEFKEKIGEEFDYGTDNKDRLEASHPGAHYHLHCAEAFENKMKELGWSI